MSIFTKKTDSKGFTLIELLVVIAIIGMLAAIVLASLNSARLKSRDAKRVADLKQVKLALELYFDSHGSQYPTNTQTLTVLTANGCTGDPLNGPKCMSILPIDPVNDATHYYAYSVGTGNITYILGATLEDPGNLVIKTGLNSGTAAQAGFGSGTATLTCTNNANIYCTAP